MSIAGRRMVNISTDRREFDSVFNGYRVQGYFNEVIQQALGTLRSQIESVSEKREGGWPFIVDHLEQVEKSTVEAFVLALQSIWERQLRAYLAHHQPRNLDPKNLQKALWPNLQSYFRVWRGVALDEFDSFTWLNLLQELGNACRHGDGRASHTLFKDYPELWPDWPPQTWEFEAGLPLSPAPPTGPPSFRDIVIPSEWLARFADAIAWFWTDVEYLYLQDLVGKAPDIPRKLQEMEAAWAARTTTITFPSKDDP